MKIYSYPIIPEDVAEGLQEGNPSIRAQNACECGCSPLPFVSISDGNIGLTAEFESEAEIEDFKRLANELNVNVKQPV
ncbi:MAG: hypothetical protein DDT33_01586 [Firmicutes bacterium]|nr:hypothetical protein [Bacillota bacterium]